MPPRTRNTKRKAVREPVEASSPSSEDGVDWSAAEQEEPGVDLPDDMETESQVAQRLRRLHKRTLIPSQFIDTELIQELGIEPTIRLLTGRIHIWDFLSTPVPTYRDLTLNFLSTFDFSKREDTVSFIIKGQDFTLSIQQLNDLLGFPTDPPEENQPHMARYEGYGADFTSEATFLASIIGSNFFSQRSSNISHPALRYLQRVLSRTFFARGETVGNFMKRETYYLYCMLTRNNDEPHLQPNLAFFLAERFRQVINVSETGGNISIGGMVTKIAMALGLDPADGTDTLVEGSITLDAPYLVSAVYIDRARGRYRHITKDHKKIDLPVTLVDPLNPNTWCLACDVTQHHQPPHGASTSAPLPAEGGPSMQAVLDQLAQVRDTMVTSFAQLNTHVVEGFAQINTRLDRVETEQGRLSTRVDQIHHNAEEDSHRTWYSYQVNQRTNDYNVDQSIFDIEKQPIPPRPRKRDRAESSRQRQTPPPPPPPQ